MSVTEAQRRAIFADFAHPLWGGALDHELADHHGVTPGDVRALRAEHRRNMGGHALYQAAAALAEEVQWPGSIGELITACVAQAYDRAERRGFRHSSPSMAELADALRAERTDRELERLSGQVDESSTCEPTSSGQGHSVDRARSRSQARAEASEGVSGDRDPRRPVSRGTGWGRSRHGHGSAAAAVTREG